MFVGLKGVGLAAAFTVSLLAKNAAAEPDVVPELKPAPDVHLRMKGYSILLTESATHYLLPPGRYLEESFFAQKDAELKALQAERTKLAAENQVYREEADGWQPGWKTIAAAFVVGIAAGGYAFTR